MRELSSSSQDFFARFAFTPERAGCIGIEREHFLVSEIDGWYAPRAEEFLRVMDSRAWTYELSACQVESRTSPRRNIAGLKSELLADEENGTVAAGALNLRLLNREVADEGMPLAVYPDPRYKTIVASISEERLRAACRVAGTHLHIGARDMEHALALNNLFAGEFDRLCAVGDHSNGERLRLYKVMAAKWRPVLYRNAEHFYEVARTDNFLKNPRNCWNLIRVSIHGTVELRMFGATDDVDEIIEWISLVRTIGKGTI